MGAYPRYFPKQFKDSSTVLAEHSRALRFLPPPKLLKLLILSFSDEQIMTALAGNS